jgi:hypothetical protein
MWMVLDLNPAHVTEQRRVLGKRGIKTDQIDLAAMFDLLLVGRGRPANRRGQALLELQAWVAMRHRRIRAVIAVKNQLLGQMDRAFPGAGRCVSGSLLDTKVGRLVIAEFSDPARLARLGPERFRRFAANRDVMVARKSPTGSWRLPGRHCRCKAPRRPASWWPRTCSCCSGSKPTPLTPQTAWPSCCRPPRSGS